MLQIRPKLLFTLLGVLASVVVLAQIEAIAQGAPPDSVDDRVLNAPYSAKRNHTEYDEKSVDDLTKRIETVGSEARDSQGRTYSADERVWTYLQGNKRVLGREMLYKIDDPVAHTATSWDSSSKIAKVFHLPQGVAGKNTTMAQCPACLQARLKAPGDDLGASMIAMGAVAQKLGTKTIGGFVAQGTRITVKNPVGGDAVHESWYCSELKILVLTIDNSPVVGSSRSELIDIVRGQPDVTKYQPPAGYVVQDVQIQLPH